MLAMAAALGPCVSAQAQDAKTALKDACRDDFKKLCGSALPGGGRLKQCMKDNAANLSERCRTAITAQKAVAEAKKTAIETPKK